MVAFVAAIVSGNGPRCYLLVILYPLSFALFLPVPLSVSAFPFQILVAELLAADDLIVNRLRYGAARLLFPWPALFFQHQEQLEYQPVLPMGLVAYLSNELRRCHPSIYKCQLPAVVQVELAGASLGASKPVWKH